MILINFGAMIAGLSCVGIKNALDNMERVRQQKNTLMNSKKLFQDLDQSDVSKPMLTCINNKTKSGILNIYKEHIVPYYNFVFKDEKFKKIEIESKVVNKLHNTLLHNPSFGLTNFVYPNDVSKFLSTKNDIMTFTGTSKAMTDHFKNAYGLQLCLPHGKFTSNFTSFENKTIYAYGYCDKDSEIGTNSVKFNAELVGTDVNKVVDKVYENDEKANDLILVVSIAGLITGAINISLGLNSK